MANEKLENFYLTKEEPIQGCLLAMRSIILKIDEEITETIKYGMPCFCYRGKMFAYLWMDKKAQQPYILFVEGKYLNHPQLEAGNRARMKVFRVHPNKDLLLNTIEGLLNNALDLYRNGVIKVK